MRDGICRLCYLQDLNGQIGCEEPGRRESRNRWLQDGAVYRALDSNNAYGVAVPLPSSSFMRPSQIDANAEIHTLQYPSAPSMLIPCVAQIFTVALDHVLKPKSLLTPSLTRVSKSSL